MLDIPADRGRDVRHRFSAAHPDRAGGSDLHIKVGSPPIARLHGELAHLEGYQPLGPEDTEKAFKDMAEARSLAEFEDDGEADFSYSIPGLARFRVNAFKQRGSISIVCRAIPFEIRSVEELGLPASSPAWPKSSAGSSSSPAPPARARARPWRR